MKYFCILGGGSSEGRDAEYMCGFYKKQLLPLLFSVQHPAVLVCGGGGGGGGFAENILKIEAWKPICQVEVCRRRSPGYRDTKLGCELSCPPRLILAGGAPRGSREGLNDHACMA